MKLCINILSKMAVFLENFIIFVELIICIKQYLVMKNKRVILFFFAIILVLSSCTTQKIFVDNIEEKNSDATLIVMAYPQEVVRTTEAFYSKLLPLIGMGKPGFIRGGHACMIIIKNGSETFEYFDFGRYITPEGYARARGANTDPETTVDIKARWSGNKITNLPELLSWLYDHPEKTRGYGDLYASVCSTVNYESVKKYIKIIQDKGVMTYGPFDKKGTNCSRFVTDAMSNGITDKTIQKRVKKSYNLTPSVLANVGSANSYDYYWIATKDSVYTSTRKIKKVQREILLDWGKGYDHVVDSYVGTLLPPTSKGSADWQWLGGFGYGVWYNIEGTDEINVYKVSQFSVDGELMWSELFKSEQSIDILQPFTFDYPSHYEIVTINSNNTKHTLHRVK